MGEICSRGCGRGGKNTLPLWACDFRMFLSQVLKVVKCYSLLFYMSILYDYYMCPDWCPKFIVHIGPADLNISRVLPIRYDALEI